MLEEKREILKPRGMSLLEKAKNFFTKENRRKIWKQNFKEEEVERADLERM